MTWRAVVLLVVAGCGAPTPEAKKPGPTPVANGELHNLYRLSDQLYSGSGPEGDAGFAAVQKLGVRTVISVDGAAPDVKTAERFGLRYVHIPVGYDGIPKDRAWQIAKAVRDLPGPVYIHCHHGKHRGPAAVACVLLALDPTCTPEEASAWLSLAGTDPRYAGLVGLPKTLARPSAADLDVFPADFPPVAAVPDLTRLMVAIDARWEHLKASKSAGWKPPPDHPDIDPPHEAVQLMELYREAARLSDATRHGDEFLTLLQEAEVAAGELEKALRTNPGAAQPTFAKSQALCAKCHAKYRD